ncbi:MAG: hypothetical protein ACJASQ_001198 [Crocinitomicaceae bacterium]|jgi:hypothetical protein
MAKELDRKLIYFEIEKILMEFQDVLIELNQIENPNKELNEFITDSDKMIKVLKLKYLSNPPQVEFVEMIKTSSPLLSMIEIIQNYNRREPGFYACFSDKSYRDRIVETLNSSMRRISKLDATYKNR